ncbi:MAG: T9SS type A sorting domain-containing protein [Candidatus Kapabacteria bacterium]|nr:T9SS type A sorting domain-containing protein [Ignavibacteriota bacterium]MCW5884769.1 T9SS type A sorting domain-containing protein [Candidatus Kapabacteria bacterium]
MKKVFFLMIAVLAFSITLKAQEFDFVSARQAHTVLVSGVPNLDDEYELFSVVALHFPMFGIELDFETGNAQMWNFSFKSKDINDESLYEYTIFRINGEFTYELSVAEDEYVQENRTLVNTWKNSTVFADEYKKSTALTNFYIENSESIDLIIYELLYADELDTDIWSVYLFSGEEKFIGCAYQATTLELIECLDNTTSVADKLARATKLFPQPSKDYLNIELPFTGDVRLELYNTNGIVLKSMNLNTNGDVQFNTSDLTTGVYNLVIKNNNSTFSKKVIVTR